MTASEPLAARVALRPLRRSDRAALLRVLEQLSLESRLNRFLAPIGTPSESLLAQLAHVDEHDRLGCLVLVEEAGESVPIAVAHSFRAADSRAAELALAVADDFQRRGVGTLLLRALALVARRHGVDRFTGQLRAENGAMRALLRASGASVAYDEPGLLRFELPLDAFVAGAPITT
jgi:acetyltransferase